MGISNSPDVIGAFLVAESSAGVSLIDTNGLTQGTQVYNVTTGSYFQLVASSASLSATVLAVLGTAGARWIEITSTAPGGNVTTAELSSTDVDSGATMVGVNANGGMFSEPDLQGVLQEDVVLKAPLAAVDGSGGGSLVGIQDTGGYFAGTNAETVTQNIGASLALKQIIAQPPPFTLTGSATLEADYVSAVSSGTVDTAVLQRQTSAPPAEVSMGTGLLFKMPDTSGTMQSTGRIENRFRQIGALLTNCSTDIIMWAVNGAAGLIEAARFGNFQSRFLDGAVSNPGVSLLSDSSAGMSMESSILGIGMGGARQIGIQSAKIAFLGSAGTPVVAAAVGATLTNNVTSGGTANTIDNWTSLTVYSTDAAAIRNAIYQLTVKVRALEVQDKALGLTVT